MGENWGQANTLEGEVCKISDVIAYINHDIDDAIRANMITEDELPGGSTRLLGHSRSARINTMVSDIVENSWSVTGTDPSVKPAIQMSEPIREATRQLHEFLYRRVYTSSSALPDAENARKIVNALYRFFNENRDLLPPEYHDPKYQVIDYIASMTDYYAIRKSQELGL
jgi:dGTPase